MLVNDRGGTCRWWDGLQSVFSLDHTRASTASTSFELCPWTALSIQFVWSLLDMTSRLKEKHLGIPQLLVKLTSWDFPPDWSVTDIPSHTSYLGTSWPERLSAAAVCKMYQVSVIAATTQEFHAAFRNPGFDRAKDGCYQFKLFFNNNSC